MGEGGDRRDVARGWALIAIATGLAFLFLRGQWALDLSAIYVAAHLFGSGQVDLIYLSGPDVFVAEPPPAYVALFTEATGRPPEEARFTPYLYPPLWAAALAPLAARLSAIAFFDLFQIANLAALAGTIWLAFRFARVPGVGFLRWAALSVLLFGVTGAGAVGLWFGQPQIIVNFLIMLSAWALAERRDLGAGAALALAAAIKLSPALLVVLFVMERRWRALGAFVAVGGLLGAVSVTVAGWPLHAEMLDKIAAIEGQVLVSRIVVSLELWLAQLAGAGAPGWAFPAPFMVPEPGWIAWVVRGALLAGLVLSWAATRHLADRPRLWARLLAVLLVTLVTSPLGWVHYLALPLLLLPGFGHIVPPRAVMRLAAVTAALLSMPLLIVLSESDALAFVQAGINLAVALGLLVFLLTKAAQSPDQALRPAVPSL